MLYRKSAKGYNRVTFEIEAENDALGNTLKASELYSPSRCKQRDRQNYEIY